MNAANRWWCQAVACPSCGAPRGVLCTTAGGRTAQYAHSARAALGRASGVLERHT